MGRMHMRAAIMRLIEANFVIFADRPYYHITRRKPPGTT